MTKREARCNCGKLTAAVGGEPVRISVCHCRACQRRTGSVFGAQARFHDRDVTFSGASREYVRVADSGDRVTFHFCPDCGATVWYRLDAVPGFVAIPVGAFADPDFPPPRVSVYESRRHAWVVLPEEVERLD